MSNKLGDILTGVDSLRGAHVKPPQSVVGTRVPVDKLLMALDQFGECVRYLNTRRSGGALLSLTDEAAVQDALYLMLRPWIMDLVPENPTDKVGNRYSIKDFLSQSGRFVVEVKYVRSAEHGKSIVREINDDIETYRYHAYCDDLVFFIYDPDGFIPDAGALDRHVTASRLYGEKMLRCHCIIKP